MPDLYNRLPTKMSAPFYYVIRVEAKKKEVGNIFFKRHDVFSCLYFRKG